MTVLDTSILIDVLRGDARAVRYVIGLTEVPSCSEISRVEVARGLRSAGRRSAERLFATLRWIPVDETVARTAGELGRAFRRSHDLSVPDLVVAATAEVLGAPPATADTRDYPMFRGLRAPY